MGSAVESALDCRSLRSELRQGFSFNQDKTIASNPCKQFFTDFSGTEAKRLELLRAFIKSNSLVLAQKPNFRYGCDFDNSLC